MTKEHLLALLLQHGHRARIKKMEVQIESCLQCGNPKYNLEINVERGVFKCWACGYSGAASEAIRRATGVDVYIPINYDASEARRRELPDAPEVDAKPVMEIASAVEYLRQRGFDKYSIERYGLMVGVNREADLYGRIIIPLVEYWTQKCYGFAGRDYIGRLPKYFITSPVKYISGWRQMSRTHVLCEGPVDALKAHMAGMNAAFLQGVSGADVAEWAARVPMHDVVVILLDGAAAEEANKLYWTVKPVHDRTLKVDLPERMDPGMLMPTVLHRLVHKNIALYANTMEAH